MFKGFRHERESLVNFLKEENINVWGRVCDWAAATRFKWTPVFICNTLHSSVGEVAASARGSRGVRLWNTVSLQVANMKRGLKARVVCDSFVYFLVQFPYFIRKTGLRYTAVCIRNYLWINWRIFIELRTDFLSHFYLFLICNFLPMLIPSTLWFDLLRWKRH